MAARGRGLFSKYIYKEKFKKSSCQKPMDRFQYNLAGIFLWWPSTKIVQAVMIHQTRGPWWSYIAHLSKQLCKLTVEVSAKFTALRFLYKFYSPTPERLCFFHASWLLELNLERRSPKEQFCKLYWNWSSGFRQKDFWSVLYSYIGKISPTP